MRIQERPVESVAALRERRGFLEDNLARVLNGEIPLSESDAGIAAGKRRVNVLPGTPDYPEMQQAIKEQIEATLAAVDAQLQVTEKL
jgi:MinD-like ATPase involved in chromosome partitioning or flagellar assembly